ncbi:hypothetical protein [Domibacillus robiginosus]|uniref:hypothetical protein n=1 Tax=Domibacillus robiginosus TaxID=1071054 RepID=UPI00067B5AC2|nr:hypothetical protein [Domibacillus robiginosus]
MLNSYFYLRRKKNLDDWLQKLQEAEIRLLVDSGAFTLYNRLEKGCNEEQITIEEYAEFINANHEKIHGYFNLDVINDPNQSEINYELLTKLTGKRPIPVWQCDTQKWHRSDWDSLDRIVQEDHELIAIGGTVLLGKQAGPKYQDEVKRKLFKEVFRRYPEQNFHWLGGSSNLLLEFPFFSADSSGWINGRKKQSNLCL